MTPLFVAFAATLCATPLAVIVSHRFGVVDRPGPRKPQPRPIPLLGGGALAVGIVAGLLADVELSPEAPLLIGAAGVWFTGLLDDLRPDGLSPLSKLSGIVLAAGLAASVLAPPGETPLGFCGTALWIVAVATSFNTSDNMNGLSVGLAVAPVLACGGLSHSGRLAELGAAAGLGFLPFNYPRARIFAGDAGAHLLGYGLAVATCPWVVGPVGVSLAAVPLLDAGFVTVLRLRAGAKPWVGDRRHLSHQLVDRGCPPAAAVALLWAVAFLAVWLSRP